jgi:hypothetical protein
VQESPDLTAWTTVPDAQISTTATTETRRATVNNAGRPRFFLRLNVSIAP